MSRTVSFILQARAPPRGDGVAEQARAAELDMAQGEHGEAREDAGGRDGDAEAAEVEGDGGGVLEAGEVKGASFLAGVVGARPRHPVGEGEAAGEAARGSGEPGRHGRYIFFWRVRGKYIGTIER